ncbi:hypothetical protein PspLS_00123 [Pyricularia sp. CBS 133598]|nr:hypothetical protein PspLS_00123 [Pyricularia sp. CBS 133598]
MAHGVLSSAPSLQVLMKTRAPSCNVQQLKSMLIAQVAATPITTGNGQLAERGFVTPPPIGSGDQPPIRHEHNGPGGRR